MIYNDVIYGKNIDQSSSMDEQFIYAFRIEQPEPHSPPIADE